MLGKKCKKSVSEFICENCDYVTSVKQHYEKHLSTDKHKRLVNASESASKSVNHLFHCHCGNTYRHDSSYYRHNKTCKSVKKIDSNNDDSNVTIAKEEYIKLLSNPELIYKMFEQNMEIINLNKELQTTIVNMSKQTGSQNNNTNSNNITNNSNNKTAFNLNVYLNETCKDAMNLSEFVETVVPTFEELERTGREGHDKGVSSIISTRLRDLEKELRPIHCTDGKREIFYVKENNIWNKEADEKPLLIYAIKKIAQKNIKNILHWRDAHPGCTQSDSNKNDLYLKILMNAMSGGTQEETEKNIEKIIRSITKYTQIDKAISL
uniref:C2H2-type domain-containing protein n=1 Tax=viral metagenome TaxID=1070528 RepID=A0A6C0IS87_9ZZZZ